MNPFLAHNKKQFLSNTSRTKKTSQIYMNNKNDDKKLK